MNASCEQCELYKTTKSPNILPVIDQRKHPKLPDTVSLLVLTVCPTEIEDKMGRLLAQDCTISGFLQEFLNRLEIRWAVVPLLRCRPKDQATTDQVTLCANEFLTKTISQLKPKVIVCLGMTVMRSLLGPLLPKAMRVPDKAVRKLPGTNIVILGAKEPEAHTTGTADVFRDYSAIFQLAERICLGKIKHENFNEEHFTNPIAAETRIRSITAREMFYDVETSQPRTIWHPDCKLICFSVTYCDSAGTYYSLGFSGPAMTAEIIRLLLGNRTIWGHNVKYDVQVTYNTLGVCLHSICEAVKDTLHPFHLNDQSSLENGLKALAAQHFGVEDWSDKVWNYAKDLAAQCIAFNKSMEKERRRRATVLKHIANGKKVDDHPETWPSLSEPLDEKVDLLNVPIEYVVHYCNLDTFYTARLRYEVISKLEISPLIANHMETAIKTLCRMERNGLPASKEHFLALREACENNTKAIAWRLLQEPEVQAAILYSPDVQKDVKASIRKRNPIPITHSMMLDWISFQGSSKFYEALVRNTLGVEFFGLTEKNKIKSDKALLLSAAAVKIEEDEDTGCLAYVSTIPQEERTKHNEIWRLYLLGRKSKDMVSKFVSKYEDYVLDGKLHTDFKLTKTERSGQTVTGADDLEGGAGTGRLSSANPPLHNVKKDRVLRTCFRCQPGWMFLECDYHQIEPVCIAVVSDCAAWKKVFAPNGHWLLYEEIANDIYHLGVTLGDSAEENKRLLKTHIPKSSIYRSNAKTRTLAKIYGESAWGFAIKGGIPLEEAEEFFDKFNLHYPEIDAYQARMRRLVSKGAFVTTLYGRRRRFPLAPNQKPGKTFRQAANFPIQSLASDICVDKADKVVQWIDNSQLQDSVFLVNSVHDALLFQIKEEMLQQVVPEVIKIMEDASSLPIEFSLPLRVSPKIGSNLGSMKDYVWR